MHLKAHNVMSKLSAQPLTKDSSIVKITAFRSVSPKLGRKSSGRRVGFIPSLNRMLCIEGFEYFSKGPDFCSFF